MFYEYDGRSAARSEHLYRRTTRVATSDDHAISIDHTDVIICPGAQDENLSLCLWLDPMVF